MKLNSSLEISAKELHHKLQTNQELKLIDVRSPHEFEDWSILDSQNIPLRQLIENHDLGKDLRDKQVVSICTRGKDSRVAAKILQDKGVRARSLQGGLKEWNNVLDIIEIPTNEPGLQIAQFRRVAKGCLSYIIAHDGEAVIIDPVHDIRPYNSYVEDVGLTITHVLDTHCHADHVSGARDLADKMDAKLLLSAQDPFVYEFTPIKNDDSIQVGEQSITVMNTPGHTKGSITFRIRHQGIFSGDIVFADGIGRPDLADQIEEFAGDLFETLTTTIAKLPGEEFIAPGHHGKFTKNHFQKPILSTIRDFSQDAVHSLDRKKFVINAKESINKIQKPPSYKTIIQINAGNVFMTADQIQELEIGPNRCAIG